MDLNPSVGQLVHRRPTRGALGRELVFELVDFGRVSLCDHDVE